jgi:hypothetical protein
VAEPIISLSEITRLYTVGTAYTLAGVAFAKLDFSHRRLGDSSRFRPENTVRLSTGFSY